MTLANFNYLSNFLVSYYSAFFSKNLKAIMQLCYDSELSKFKDSKNIGIIIEV